jgi:hypothetical protein
MKSKGIPTNAVRIPSDFIARSATLRSLDCGLVREATDPSVQDAIEMALSNMRQQSCQPAFARSLKHFFFQQLQQIRAIPIVLHRGCRGLELLGADVSETVSNFLRTRNHQPLSSFDSLDK